MTRKSKPWAVVLTTASGPIRSEYTGEAKAYEQVRAELAAVEAGTSQTSSIRVEQWEPTGNRWVWFDEISPNEN